MVDQRFVMNAVFTRQGLRAGAAGVAAVAASVFAYGIVFGVLAEQSGLSVAAALSAHL